MKKRILVLASANRDMILEMDHMPAPGETFRAESYGYAVGGKGSNAAVAFARQDAAVTIAACLGDDKDGHAIAESYNEEGLDTRAVRFTDRAQTGFALCTVEHDGNSRIIVVPGANEHFSFDDIPKEILDEPFDAMMTQFEVPFDSVVKGCAWAASRGIPVIIDAGPALPLPLEELRGITIFSPNETETTLLTGGMPVETMDDCLLAAQDLYKRTQAKFVVLKLGARGAFIYDGRESTFVPSFRVDAVDPTAAGDSFTAALALGYVQTHDIFAAVRRANAAGALAATRMGAQPSLPKKEEIDAFLAVQKD